MSKKHTIKTANIENNIMAKIKSGQISMKPRWYFVLGSFLSMIGLISTGIVATFLVNLTIFLLRQHGPNGQWRLQMILDSFPLWIPLLAVFGIILGIWMLKKYDFSYRKNFLQIVLMVVFSIIFVAFVLDYTGLNNIWMRRGPMMRFNQNYSQRGVDESKWGRGSAYQK